MPAVDVDKENRPPRGMAADGKKTPKGSTPGRPKRKGNEFFDVGKVGRYAYRIRARDSCGAD